MADFESFYKNAEPTPLAYNGKIPLQPEELLLYSLLNVSLSSKPLTLSRAILQKSPVIVEYEVIVPVEGDLKYILMGNPRISDIDHTFLPQQVLNIKLLKLKLFMLMKSLENMKVCPCIERSTNVTTIHATGIIVIGVMNFVLRNC